jgi:hypothetical protein
MVSTFIPIVLHDAPYLVVALILLGIVALIARATERSLHGGAGLDSADVQFMNNLRLLIGLAAIVLLVVAWRLALALAIVALVVVVIRGGWNSRGDGNIKDLRTVADQSPESQVVAKKEREDVESE